MHIKTYMTVDYCDICGFVPFFFSEFQIKNIKNTTTFQPILLKTNTKIIYNTKRILTRCTAQIKNILLAYSFQTYFS